MSDGGNFRRDWRPLWGLAIGFPVAALFVSVFGLLKTERGVFDYRD